MDFTQKDLFATDLNNNVTGGSGFDTLFDTTTYTLSNLSLTTNSVSISQPWVTTSGTSGLTWANLSEPPSGRITLQGPDADIEVNGESLMNIIRRMEQRLNLLTPNKELEAEWDQLRELGDQYRALEQKLTEQGKMWDTLKKMPPPEIK